MNNCSFNWTEICQIAGSCTRPGGPVLTEKALKFCKLSPGSLIVDIGCGAGGTLKLLGHSGIFRTVGIDFSEDLLRQAATHSTPGLLIQAKAETLPLKKDTFDAIFCECALSILTDKIIALREYMRVLKKGGHMIISDVFRQEPPKQEQPEKTQAVLGIPPFNKEDIIDLLEGFGFSILLWEDHKRFLKEFLARLILSGQNLPDAWGCGRPQSVKTKDFVKISYFLMIARKN
jgi:arsenite methyltransferase